MLKIKENVDLSELEKYGFVKSNNFYYKEVEIKYNFDSCVWVDNNRNISLDVEVGVSDECTLSIEEGLDTIYDLIKNDLVEKY